MRIQNNMTAMNTHRQYNIANNAVASSAEKLSSGYKINRAGDDAAGLAISEKMRAQIRGLNMASKNSSDAISLVQTAEGALQETHNILQRMRELSVQSASDTNEKTIDRGALNAEFQQLKQEINDIADKTVFNDQKLIDGTFAAKKLTLGTGTNLIGGGMTTVDLGKAAEGSYTFQVSKVTVSPAVTATKPTAYALDTSSVTNANVDAGHADTKVTAGSAVTASALLNGDYTIKVTNISNPSAVEFTATGNNGQTFVTTFDMVTNPLTTAGDKVTLNFGNDAFTATFAIKNPIGTAANTAVSESQLNALGSTFDGIKFSVTGGITGKAVEEKYAATLTGGSGYGKILLEEGQSSASFSNGITVNFNKLTAANLDTTAITSLVTVFGTALGASTINVKGVENAALTVQTGSNRGDELDINIDRMDATYLNIGGSTLATREASSVAITQVNNAINQVSTQRAALGALQNRLNHKIANLDTSAENLQGAESRIRDIDMAKEMTAFSKKNILVQASTAMLAQANSAPQNVLQLLR